jgi:hypothetical protein
VSLSFVRVHKTLRMTVAGLTKSGAPVARDWERRFIGEIKAGRDPRRLPSRSIQAGTELGNVSAFLDAYVERCVKPAGLRSISAVRSRVSVLEEHLGDRPLAAREGLEVSWNNKGPTASPRIGKLIDLVVLPDCPRFVPGNIEMWLRGRATADT